MKKPSIPASRQAAREAAMPHVQRLVNEHGLTAVTACVTRLRDQKRAEAQVERATRELEALKAKAKLK